MTPKQEQAIRNHGEHIKQIFGLPADMDPLTLCKQLRRLENKAHRLAEAWCNGTIDADTYDARADKILASLNKLLNYRTQGVPVFLNSDPRGYALKIKDGFCQHLRIYKDWGGYGILAPEIGKEGY